MKNNGWKDYFSFTKRERIGAITLLFLILVVTILPQFFQLLKKPDNNNSLEDFQKEIATLEIDTNTTQSSSASETGHAAYYQPVEQSTTVKRVVFEFDPNTSSKGEWKKLGLEEHTIQTILNYLSKGGKFRKPEDLSKIYGLKKNDYNRLLPYVRIKSETALQLKKNIKGDERYASKKSNSFNIIEINSADTSMFIALPGIGSKLASRIVSFRDKLGGFYSVDQISETYGLPDSTFQLIKKLLQCNSSSVRKININSSTIEELRRHPYIKWNVANELVNFRDNHGNFGSLEDLRQLNTITPELYQKIIPYLAL